MEPVLSTELEAPPSPVSSSTTSIFRILPHVTLNNCEIIPPPRDPFVDSSRNVGISCDTNISASCLNNVSVIPAPKDTFFQGTHPFEANNAPSSAQLLSAYLSNSNYIPPPYDCQFSSQNEIDITPPKPCAAFYENSSMSQKNELNILEFTSKLLKI